jgi:PAS domain S-box-containing protein
MANLLHTSAAPDGDSGVRRLLREHDWHASPLGAPDTWPPELATAVSMVLSSAFPMFVAWGPALTFLYNDAYAPILGDKHPAGFGQPFQQVWWDIWPDLVPIVDRALSNESAYFEDLPLFMKRKGYREQTYFTFSYSPLHDGAGQVRGLYCACNETTARVESERRAAFELAVADALRPLASSGDAIRTGCRLLGEQLAPARVLYGEVDATRDTFHIPGDWQRAGLASIAGRTFALATFGPVTADAWRTGAVLALDDVRTDPRTAAHQTAWAALDTVALLLVPLVREGRLAAFVAVCTDGPQRWSEAGIALARSLAERLWTMVDLARAQALLRVERDRSQTIFDTIAEGFVLIASDWTVLQMNAAGLRLSGRTAEQAIGRRHWDVWPEMRDSSAGRTYLKAMDERVAGRTEHPHLLPDGSTTWFEVRAYPVADGGLVCFFLDISERKLAEDKLRAADRRKDEFLAMLAHELRNPLAPISAAADLLRIGRFDEARVRQSSAIIGRQVRHMTRLVDDLLDVSRVTRGLVTLVRAPVSARTIVDEAVEQVRPLLEARHQRLEMDLADPDATVLGDKARLVQVLSNLLNNAAKYTPEHRCVALSARVDPARTHLLLAVRDDGIGIEPELTAHVFDLFTQAQRSIDRSQGGLGLGLALVKNLVELHGGTVACTSAGLGRGSTFEVTLPLLQDPASVGSGSGGAAAAAPTDDPRPLRLLVVDDNIDAADTLAMLLEASGYTVDVEHDSRRALEHAHRQPPDAALLDIGLPDMDGNELARRLRADPLTAGMVLVAITGYGQDQDRRAALAAGFDHHMVKPVDMGKLEGVLGGIQLC